MRQVTKRYELTQIPWLKRLLVSRWPLFLARAVTLAGFVLTIVAGLIGSPVGSHNFAIIFVWIAWWTFLKLIAIPFGGRAWCSICPIPTMGEWIQQGALVEPGGKGLGLGWQWPKRLRNVWLPTLGLGVIGLFSAVTLTQPRVTGWVLLGFILLAVVLTSSLSGVRFAVTSARLAASSDCTRGSRPSRCESKIGLCAPNTKTKLV